MGNTNFQTIHQMGTAISDMVKQATGRDDVQNIDMEHITVAQNHRYEEIDLSGQVVSFQAGEAGLPFEKMVVQIKPVQSGTGDPSPDNIRPITGWTMVNLYQAGQNMEDARVFRFTFPSEAGTVYGGTLNVLTGEMMVDRFLYVYDGTEGFTKSSTALNGFYNNLQASQLPHSWPRMINYSTELLDISTEISSMFIVTRSPAEYRNIYWRCYLDSGMNFNVDPEIFGTTTESFKAKLTELYAAGTPVSVFAKIINPLAFHLSTQEITTLLGQNYIWADTGDIEVKFTNVKEMY